MQHDFALSPGGRLYWFPPDAPPSAEPLNDGELLLALAVSSDSFPAHPALAYWREFARLFLSAYCHLATPSSPVPPPSSSELFDTVLSAPAMLGAEYISPELLTDLWKKLELAFRQKTANFPGGTEAWFEKQGLPWHRIGRVTFHLAENKKTPQTPFAFLATYVRGLSATSQEQHLPLGKAIQEYAGTGQKETLVKLLRPVHLASEKSEWVKCMVENSSIYTPQSWTISQAKLFLQDIPALEESGLLVRVPNWWHPSHRSRPTVSVQINLKKNQALGVDALLDFSAEMSLDGEALSPEERDAIQQCSEGLVFLRGRWVEVDTERLSNALAHWQRLESEQQGIDFLKGLRMLAGIPLGNTDSDWEEEIGSPWVRVEAGKQLQETLARIKTPENSRISEQEIGLCAHLRDYQSKGVSWLWFMNQIGLGACLADDMGLGKTIQVLALLLKRKKENPAALPALLVVPASLIGNWHSEASRFAPSLRLWIAHGSNPDFKNTPPPADADLVITTYGTVLRFPFLQENLWGIAILDEAQAIKNSQTKQTHAIKKIHAHHRILLTGTPVENSLSNLWSLYDFIVPGLLGKESAFAAFAKRLSENPRRFADLRQLVQPYLLRRLKTDKSVVSDLPDKTEMKTYCFLSRTQVGIYQSLVDDLSSQLESIEPQQRRGIILSYLMRFKQVCNHPDHLMGKGDFLPEKSGKFLRLAEIVATIAERQEKMLVFTQFREMTQPLADFLAKQFGQTGLVLDGKTPVAKRRELVAEFQRDSGPPFFVLSLKAGGVGLNLTQACHVVHFDRWWNPAVENQATDRAFRIGQKSAVLVHKLICSGTMEEKIDALIDQKKDLSDQVVGSSSETALTEMNDSELMHFLSLDIQSACKTE